MLATDEILKLAGEKIPLTMLLNKPQTESFYVLLLLFWKYLNFSETMYFKNIQCMNCKPWRDCFSSLTLCYSI